MAITSMLTTIDNPFDPFDDYDNWLAFDLQNGYCTNELLGRIAKTSPDLTDFDYRQAVEQAIQDIIAYDPLHIYKRVQKREDDEE